MYVFIFLSMYDSFAKGALEQPWLQRDCQHGLFAQQTWVKLPLPWFKVGGNAVPRPAISAILCSQAYKSAFSVRRNARSQARNIVLSMSNANFPMN